MRSAATEILTFVCQHEQLLGILHRGVQQNAKRGVLLVVGGPQYRAGSHRQFVLIAQGLAQAGIPVLRFDYRGMGDSEGDARDFEAIGDDIRAAADAFVEALPCLQDIVIWGLCDAASAAMFYARYDARIKGMVLLNPWVRTQAGQAKSYLRYYYTRRLLDRNFWGSLLGGKVNIFASLSSLAGMVARVLFKQKSQTANGDSADAKIAAGSLPDRMLHGIGAYAGKLLFILCGDDLTAAEFKDLVAASAEWQAVMRRQQTTRRDLPNANHTFSRREWRQQVIDWTCEWIASW